MLKTYWKYTILYGNGEKIRTDCVGCIHDDSDIDTKKRTFTWDNISEFDKRFVEIDSKRKGRLLRVYTWDGVCYWKEWKHPLDLTEVVMYEECMMSLEDIMKLRDSDTSIEYLKQRGMAVCPIR